MSSSHKPWLATKSVMASDQSAGGVATAPELTRICEAMAASASMMNWANAMAMFMVGPP